MLGLIHHKKIKKDYQRKNSPNPFFRRPPKAKNFHLTLKWWLILGFLSLFFLIWLFLAAPWWRLQKVTISGLTRVSEGEVAKIIWDQSATNHWLFFNESNIFLFDGQVASQQIIAKYNLAGVIIKKEWPHTLNLLISERPYAFIYKEGSQFFYASNDGYIIKQATVSEEDKQKYFLLENTNHDTLIADNNKINIGNEYLTFILALDAALKAQAGLPVAEFIIDSELNTVKVKFIDGPIAYFNVKDAINSQINVLLLVKKEKIKDNFKKTNYIDLRYGSRVFINPSFN
ncbi:MAG: hypothetical protein WC249_02070 [Patescibacteria group bacterium]|jgi:hypothetical protein